MTTDAYLYHDAGAGAFVLARLIGDDLTILDMGVSGEYLDLARDSLQLFLAGVWTSELPQWEYAEPESLARVQEIFRVAGLNHSH